MCRSITVVWCNVMVVLAMGWAVCAVCVGDENRVGGAIVCQAWSRPVKKIERLNLACRLSYAYLICLEHCLLKAYCGLLAYLQFYFT
jgi:hypothetical protein